MKRFITYLYECERGNKSKNVGFIRVNVRSAETVMEVFIRNFLNQNGIGKIYALVNKKNLYGIEIGEIVVSNGQGDGQMFIQTNDIRGCGESINDIVGIGIRLNGAAYIASCWVDDCSDKILKGEFVCVEETIANEAFAENVMNRSGQNEKIGEVSHLEVTEEQPIQEPIAIKKEARNNEAYRKVDYEKIDLAKIRELPSPNWYLSTNSFLVHGFWNYGYLVLKKEMEADKEKLSLGVPGVFEKPEAVMAIFFGFSAFEEIPSEMVNAKMNHDMSFPQKEKNQETEVGTFGCWFVTLQE